MADGAAAGASRRWIDAGLVLLPAVWLGMLIGVSFLATPVKFQAPSLTLPVALDVGRVTFALFTRVEWVMAASLATLVILKGMPRPSMALTLLLAVVLFVQAIWLLPALDARVASVIAGDMPPPSFHHRAYAGTEAAKLAALAALSVRGALAGRRPGSEDARVPG